MNWQLDINVLIQLFTVAAVIGMGWAKLVSLEKDFDYRVSVLSKDLERVEKEVVDSRELRSQLAVVNSKLTNIESTLVKLMDKLEKVDE